MPKKKNRNIYDDIYGTNFKIIFLSIPLTQAQAIWYNPFIWNNIEDKQEYRSRKSSLAKLIKLSFNITHIGVYISKTVFKYFAIVKQEYKLQMIEY